MRARKYREGPVRTTAQLRPVSMAAATNTSHPVTCWPTGFGLLAIWTAVACSAPSLPPQYHQAQKLERQGKLLEAQRLYARAAASCKKAKRECVETSYRAAQLLYQLKRFGEAEAAFRALEQGIGQGTQAGARALIRVADIQFRDGNVAEAERIWWSLIDHYPQQLMADEALRRLIRRYRNLGRAKTLVPLLRERFKRLRRADIGDNLLFEAALLLDEVLGQPDEAVALFLEVAKFYPKRGLADDSFWKAAGIRRRQKRFLDAIVIYRKLIATREDAGSSVSYHSVFLDDAYFAVAKIRLLDLRQPGKAVDAFQELHGLDRSILRDDAQWWTVLAEIERGRAPAAHRAYAKLLKLFPHSRYKTEAAGLKQWIAFRVAAYASRDAEACGHWAALKSTHPWKWFARHSPRPKPWPTCAAAPVTPRRAP